MGGKYISIDSKLQVCLSMCDLLAETKHCVLTSTFCNLSCVSLKSVCKPINTCVRFSCSETFSRFIATSSAWPCSFRVHKGHSEIHMDSNSTIKTRFTISTPLPPNSVEANLKHCFFLHTSLYLKEFYKAPKNLYKIF